MGNKRNLSISSDMADNNSEKSQSNVKLEILPKAQPNFNFEIRCGDHSWVVHRGNLCTKSRFFKALCDGPFEEGMHGVADLRNEDPKLVERMLVAISTPEYPVVPAKYRPENDLIEDAGLHAIADKFDIPSLRIASADAFKELLSIVGKRRSPMLFIGELLPLLYEMTPITDRILRDMFEAFVVDKWAFLLARKDLLEYALQNEQFGVFIMKENQKYWEQNGKQWCDSCKCHRTFNNSTNPPSCNGCG